MGRGYDAICNQCGTHFKANEGPGMRFLLYHCDRCGRELARDIDLRPEGVIEAGSYPDRCACGGRLTEDAPPRCPACQSADLRQDPEGYEVLYD